MCNGALACELAMDFSQSLANRVLVEPCLVRSTTHVLAMIVRAFRSVEALDDLDCPDHRCLNKRRAALVRHNRNPHRYERKLAMGTPDVAPFRCAITVLNTGAMHDQPNHKLGTCR